MGNHAAIKARARKAVHAAFSYSATYIDDTLDTAVAVDVRWHNRLVLLGDYQDGGYASVIDGIEKVIFDREQLAEKGLTPRRNGIVVIMEPGFDSTTLYLDTRENYVGPIEEKWMVKRDV